MVAKNVLQMVPLGTISMDVMIVTAQQGNGRRQNMLDDYSIPDGWIYNATIRPELPYDYRGVALRRMRALRLSTYKPYTNNTRLFTMAPFTNVQTQIRMFPGTYLWGYWLSLTPTIVDDVVGTVSPHNIYVKVTDNATGIGPFADWVSDQDLGVFPALSDVTGASANTVNFPQLMIEPYVVTDPSLFTIEFSNNGRSTETTRVQLQFLGCVPCDRVIGGVDCNFS